MKNRHVKFLVLLVTLILVSAVVSASMSQRAIDTSSKGEKRLISPGVSNFDKVVYKGKIAIVNGVHSYGKQVLCTDLLGNKFHSKISDVRLLTYGKGICFG